MVAGRDLQLRTSPAVSCILKWVSPLAIPFGGSQHKTTIAKYLSSLRRSLCWILEGRALTEARSFEDDKVTDLSPLRSCEKQTRESARALT